MLSAGPRASPANPRSGKFEYAGSRVVGLRCGHAGSERFNQTRSRSRHVRHTVSTRQPHRRSLLIAALLAIALAGVLSTPAQAQTQTRATQKVCVAAYPNANRVTDGGTTLFNRQASVREVDCNGFGGDAGFHVDGGIVCALTAAAIGPGFDKLSLFLDGSCSGAALAASHDVGIVAGAACGMLSDLLATFPPAKAYAVAAGVSCAFGKPLGDWIESQSEHAAAEGVFRSGKCLRFATHHFPVGDTWSAVPCVPGDPGFSDLPVPSSPEPPTQVVQVAPVDSGYQPIAGLDIQNRGVAEECGAGSDSVGNAYRCFSGHGVYDPCWTDDANPATPAVLCQLRPWEKRVYRFTLAQGGLQPFYEPPLPIGTYEPWGVELTTGERCIAAQGAHDGFDGGHRIVDYGCANKAGKNDGRVLLRGIDRSHPRWRITSATYNVKRNRYRLGPKLRIATAWYAMQDQGDALAAASNTCSASALAFAAEAYEAAHGEPHGPLPDIVGHACSGGYAIALFLQEAPPPGYEASFAFHATATGWAVSGSADHIGPGEFGIPEDAYGQIESGLSADRAEKVPF